MSRRSMACRCRISTHPAGSLLPGHRHEVTYLALVLEGTYEELSVDGIWRCGPGDMIAHPPFHFHINRFHGKRVRVMNLTIPRPYRSPRLGRYGVFRCPDAVEAVARGRHKVDSLVAFLPGSSACEPVAKPTGVTEMARRLSAVSPGLIRDVARPLGVSREHAARTFRRYVGFSAEEFRAESRLQRALYALISSDAPVSRIAHEAGFADHAHLVRCVRRATGLTPSGLRWRNHSSD